MNKIRSTCLAISLLPAAPALAQPFASEIIGYAPAPGQFVDDPIFNDPARALGPPVGGGILVADNTSAVTLGGVTGSITLRMPRTVLDDPRNKLGLDAIVFGNAFYFGADPTRRFAEAGLIEIALDANDNGIADDAFYVIDATHGTTLPLPAAANGPVIDAGIDATDEIIAGYADCSPVLPLPPGDDPARFYTMPDDPTTVGIDHGSAGGDAFDIAWAVHPDTHAPANLTGFDFIRITTAIDHTDPSFGEVSTEIDAIADARPPCPADTNLDGELSPTDFSAWIIAFNARSIVADQNDDALVTPTDFSAWIINYNGGCP